MAWGWRGRQRRCHAGGPAGSAAQDEEKTLSECRISEGGAVLSGKWRVFPFTALVGQEKIKRALLANAVLPSIGGVLLRGEKGTAKSTAVRGLVSLLPQSQAVAGCPWLCPSCAGKKRKGALPSVAFAPQLADVPLSASEDRVAGSLDMEAAFREGVRALQPGLLAAAHRGILYIDEVNLLPDHVADIILEACSEGVNRIRREGISAEHPSRFVLVGTMNPEEGELRPQLLDRFGLAVSVSAPGDVGERLEVLRLRERFDADPQGFLLQYAEREAALAVRIREAQRLVAQVRIPRLLLKRKAGCSGRRRAGGGGVGAGASAPYDAPAPAGTEGARAERTFPLARTGAVQTRDRWRRTKRALPFTGAAF